MQKIREGKISQSDAQYLFGLFAGRTTDTGKPLTEKILKDEMKKIENEGLNQ